MRMVQPRGHWAVTVYILAHRTLSALIYLNHVLKCVQRCFTYRRIVINKVSNLYNISLLRKMKVGLMPDMIPSARGTARIVCTISTLLGTMVQMTSPRCRPRDRKPLANRWALVRRSVNVNPFPLGPST